jgi:hypothetical protein
MESPAKNAAGNLLNKKNLNLRGLVMMLLKLLKCGFILLG